MNKKLLREGPYADFFSQGVQVGNGPILTQGSASLFVRDGGGAPCPWEGPDWRP